MLSTDILEEAYNSLPDLRTNLPEFIGASARAYHLEGNSYLPLGKPIILSKFKVEKYNHLLKTKNMLECYTFIFNIYFIINQTEEYFQQKFSLK